MGMEKIDLSLLKIDKAKYYELENDILDTNQGILRVFSLISTIVFGIMWLVSHIDSSLKNSSSLYLSFCGICLVFFMLSAFVEIDNKVVRTIGPLAFCFAMFVFGILMGTVIEPNEMTVSYIVLMLAAPLLFLTRPVYMNSIIGLSILIYLPVAFFTQDVRMFKSNLYDVIPYGIMSMLTSAFMMQMKIQRFLYKEQSNIFEVSNSKNQERIETMNQFITDMIRYSSDENDAEDVINQIMEYIGKQLCSDRAYIFERNLQGNFDNTYEWCRKGVIPEKDNLQNVPYHGMMDVWIKQFKKSSNILIYDVEDYRSESEDIYQLLKAQEVHSLVAGPITINGNIVGFYGVDNPPAESIQNISELFHLMEFVVSMMIRLRNEAKQLENSALYDQLTGSKNRKALQWAYDGQFDRDLSFTAIMCDLNGLKEVNDKQGHDAGDKFISRMAQMLNDIFGEESVYRVGGDEFVVVLVGKTREEIDKLMSMCKLQIGTTACFGVAYHEHVKDDFINIMKEADKNLYKQKDEFYHTRRKYRDV